MISGTSSHARIWSFAKLLGYDHPLLSLNSSTIIGTWALIVLIVGALVIARIAMNRSQIAYFIITKNIRSFKELVTQSTGTFSKQHLCFVGALFIFILTANCLSLIPGLEEPTTDLNTALALGFISFFYTQITAIKAGGLISYIKGFFTPFFIMFPLNVVGKCSSVISISFRLFGNIFSGAMISSIYFSSIKGSLIFQLLGVGMSIIIVLFFTLFEGFLQALVFTMLTLTYIGIATTGEGH